MKKNSLENVYKFNIPKIISPEGMGSLSFVEKEIIPFSAVTPETHTGEEKFPLIARVALSSIKNNWGGSSLTGPNKSGLHA